jgi:hypothetical protein
MILKIIKLFEIYKSKKKTQIFLVFSDLLLLISQFN